ncbi:MAG TPA: hypothetical protein VGA99_03795 [bacterium]
MNMQVKGTIESLGLDFLVVKHNTIFGDFIIVQETTFFMDATSLIIDDAGSLLAYADLRLAQPVVMKALRNENYDLIARQIKVVTADDVKTPANSPYEWEIRVF